MSGDPSDEQPVLLSTTRAKPADWYFAVPLVFLSLVVLAAAVPFAKVPVGYVWAFIPVYQTALAITELMTAGLLLAQYRIAGSRAMLVLSCGYLFTACLVVPHTLSYPGLFAEFGLLPASGPQTTAWLYMFWHAGFPIAVMIYARSSARTTDNDGGPPKASGLDVFLGIATVVLVALVLVVLATYGSALLPQIMEAHGYTTTMTDVAVGIWLLCPAALVVLWRRRPHSVLDVWLMVVLFAWLSDVALSVVFNGQRFDFGFYAGRVYGLIAATFVLLMLQVETASMYTRLGQLLSAERQSHRHEVEQRRRLFDTSLDLILIADRKGNLLQVSPSAMSILGYEPEEMMGRSARDFVYPPDLNATRRQMRLARRSGVIRHFECRYVAKSGRPVTMAWMGVWSEPEQQHFFIGRDMTEQKAAEEATRQALARQQAVFNSALIGIVTLDQHGNVEAMNPAAERMFGVPLAAAAQHDVRRIIELGGPANISSAARLQRLLDEDNVRELTGRRIDGSTFPIDFELSGMSLGSRRMFVVFVRDITDRKRHERMKDEFVATVSHELRTPLTSISASLALLAAGGVGAPGEPGRRLLSIAHSNCQRLVRLLNDILDIDKIESGRMAFTLRTVDLCALADDAIEASRGLAEGFGVAVRLDPASCETMVRVDADRMTQVVLNLLSNGLKFSPHGDEVVVKVERSGERARLTVSDHGPGVPEEYRERIFEKFVQVDASDARQKGGTGLGLSIVRQIVLRLGGEVTVEPASGGGSTFRVELPLCDEADLPTPGAVRSPMGAVA